MTSPYLALPLAFGLVAPMIGQITGSESLWIGQTVGGVSFGVLFALLLRWLTGKWDQRQEQLTREVQAMRLLLSDTIGDWNKVQLLQLADRGATEAVREEAKRIIAERERRDKNHGS